MAWKFRNKTLRKIENGIATGDCDNEYIPNIINSGVRVECDGLRKDYIKLLENGELDKDDKSKKYFSYDGFYDLIDSNQDINDYCKGYTYKQLFTALTTPCVYDYQAFCYTLGIITNKFLTDENNIIKTVCDNCE